MSKILKLDNGHCIYEKSDVHFVHHNGKLMVLKDLVWQNVSDLKKRDLNFISGIVGPDYKFPWARELSDALKRATDGDFFFSDADALSTYVSLGDVDIESYLRLRQDDLEKLIANSIDDKEEGIIRFYNPPKTGYSWKDMSKHLYAEAKQVPSSDTHYVLRLMRDGILTPYVGTWKDPTKKPVGDDIRFDLDRNEVFATILRLFG